MSEIATPSENVNFEQFIRKAFEIVNKCEIPERHSYFQLEKFVIGKEPTGQAKLWQIIRELKVRLDTFDSIKMQLEDAEDNLELLDIKMEKKHLQIKQEAQRNDELAKLNIREMELEIRKLHREKKSLVESSRKLRKKFKYLLEEIVFLVNGFEKILEKCGEFKSFDDPEAQREMWNERLLEEFNLRVIFQKPMDTEFIKTILCLPDNAPVKKHVVSLIHNIQNKLISNYENKLTKKEPAEPVNKEIRGKIKRSK